MTQPRSEVRQGTLEMLVRTRVALEPSHGWGNSFRLRLMSRDLFDVNQGSLDPALQRMLFRGFITSKARASDNNRWACCYAITREGRRQLASEISGCERSSGAVNRVPRIAA